MRVPLEREEDPGVREGPRRPELPSVFSLRTEECDLVPRRGYLSAERIYTLEHTHGYIDMYLYILFMLHIVLDI